MAALLQPGLKIITLGDQRLRGGKAYFLEAALLGGLDQVVLYCYGSIADGCSRYLGNHVPARWRTVQYRAIMIFLSMIFPYSIHSPHFQPSTGAPKP